MNTTVELVQAPQAQADHVSLALLAQTVGQMDTKLDTIQAAVLKTNGRVDRLESWRDRMTGAWIVLSFAGPVVTGLVVALASHALG